MNRCPVMLAFFLPGGKTAITLTGCLAGQDWAAAIGASAAKSAVAAVKSAIRMAFM